MTPRQGILETTTACVIEFKILIDVSHTAGDHHPWGCVLHESASTTILHTASRIEYRNDADFDSNERNCQEVVFYERETSKYAHMSPVDPVNNAVVAHVGDCFSCVGHVHDTSSHDLGFQGNPLKVSTVHSPSSKPSVFDLFEISSTITASGEEYSDAVDFYSSHARESDCEEVNVFERACSEAVFKSPSAPVKKHSCS